MKYVLVILLISCAFNLKAQPPGQPVGKIIEPFPYELKDMLVRHDTNFVFNKHYYEAENQWVTYPKNPKYVLTKGMYTLYFIYFDAQAGYTMINWGLFDIDATGSAFRDTTPSKLRLPLNAAALNSGPLKLQIPVDGSLVTIIPDKMLDDMKIKKIPDWLPKYRRNNPYTFKTLTKKLLFGHTFIIQAKDAAQHIGENAEVTGICYRVAVRLDKLYPDSARVLEYWGSKDNRDENFINIIKVNIKKDKTMAKWVQNMQAVENNPKLLTGNSAHADPRLNESVTQGKITLFESKPAVITDEIMISEPVD